MNIFIGLDVSLASTAACIIDERGKILKESKLDSEPAALIAFLSGLTGSVVTAGLEAGPLSRWLHRPLTKAGFEVVLMETRQVKGALKVMPIKTDRRDAEGIARLLQMGWFRPVHCKSVSAQEMRAVLTARKAVQKAILDIEFSLRGVLRNFGLKMGKVSKGRYEARVRDLVVGNAMLETMSEALLRVRAGLRAELAGLERRLRDLAREDAACRRMMTMPGVGPVVALTVKSAIDDPGQFKSSKDVGPWAGLTPGRYQSGEVDVVGPVTRAGDVGLHTALYQAATVMMHRSKPSWLKAWGVQVARRRGTKRAVVAMARRIGVVLRRMWMDGTEFRFTRSNGSDCPPSCTAVAAMLKTIFARETKAEAQAQWDTVADALREKQDKLGAFMDASRDDVLAYMDFPREHWTQIASTNPLERVNREIKRRADVVGIIPNDGALIRLLGALMLETNDEWTVARRYMSLETLARVTDNPPVRLPAVAT